MLCPAPHFSVYTFASCSFSYHQSLTQTLVLCARQQQQQQHEDGSTEKEIRVSEVHYYFVVEPRSHFLSFFKEKMFVLNNKKKMYPSLNGAKRRNGNCCCWQQCVCVYLNKRGMTTSQKDERKEKETRTKNEARFKSCNDPSEIDFFFHSLFKEEKRLRSFLRLCQPSSSSRREKVFPWMAKSLKDCRTRFLLGYESSQYSK